MGRKPTIALSYCNGYTSLIHPLPSPDTLPSTCGQHLWNLILPYGTGGSVLNSACVQTWVMRFLCYIVKKSHDLLQCMQCTHCSFNVLAVKVTLEIPPPLLLFEEVLGTMPRLDPSPAVNLPAVEGETVYDLCGIVYLEDYHFTAEIIGPPPVGGHWLYDSQKANGSLMRYECRPPGELPASRIYVYVLRS